MGSRAQWGGQANTGDLFTSLVNADFAQIKQGVATTLRNAQDQQAATDTETQAKWTAGKISDEQWLAYIKQRIAGTTDPTDRAQWQQILLQNQDAISDAQYETKFRLNQITVGQLVQHYRVRMAGIATDSPAYRDLATRLTDLNQFQQSGGVHYSDQYKRSSGGGGGGGGASGTAGGNADIANIVNKGLKGGKTPIGYQGGQVYDTTGPDVVSTLFSAPKSAKTASAQYTNIANSAIDGLQGSMTLLQGFFDFLKNNPTATVYTDPMGHVIPVNPDTVRAADDQFLRLKQTTAAVYYAKGDRSSGDTQLADATTFVSTTMRDHNSAAIQPAMDAFLGLTKATLIQISQIPDPAQRSKAYAQLAKAADDFANRALPQSTVLSTKNVVSSPATNTRDTTPAVQKITTTSRNALEDFVDPKTYDQFAALRQALDIGANPSQYDDQAVNDAFDQATALGDIGTGAAKFTIADMYGTDGNSSFGKGGFVGVATTRVQAHGLAVAQQIEEGTIGAAEAVDADGSPIPLFTYSWDGQARKLTLRDAVTQNINGVPTVVPVAGTNAAGVAVAADNGVAFVTHMNGKTVRVWTTENTDVPASGYVYRFAGSMHIGDLDYAKGDLVPSSVLKAWGQSGIGQEVRAGQIGKDTLPGTKTANIGGSTWYYDTRTNAWSSVMPWNLSRDPTDPNAVEVSDPTLSQKADGTNQIDRNNLPANNVQIAMGLVPGLHGYATPYVGMTGQEAQNWYDREVALGRAQNDTQHLAPDGHTMVQDDANAMYYNPTENDLYSQADYRSQQARNQQAYAISQYGTGPEPNNDPAAIQQYANLDNEWRQWNQARSQRGFWKSAPANAAPASPADAVLSRVRDFGEALGVNTGQNAPSLQAAEAGLQKATSADRLYGAYDPGISQFQRDALVATVNRMKSDLLPKLQPLPARPKPPVLAPLKAPVPHQVAPIEDLPTPAALPSHTAPAPATIKAPKGSKYAGKSVPL